MARAIRFFVDGSPFKLKSQANVRAWLERVATAHGASVSSLNYVFVTDDALLKMNQEFLQHDTLTDIITFPDQSSTLSSIVGEVYVSVDRVIENAQELGVDFNIELRRVMSHGLLHLIGFKDKSAKDIKAMRGAEDDALSLWDN
jgi:probable rRNA maturation factor